MPLTRTPHWATRELHDFFRSRHRMPFAWGVNDCALFAADAIQSFTGVDIASDFRNKYFEEDGAFAAIAAVAGGQTIADAAAYCARQHGLPEWEHPLKAQRGDLVVMHNPASDLRDQNIAGVVHLSGAHLVTVGQHGLVRLPVTAVLRAWRVG